MGKETLNPFSPGCSSQTTHPQPCFPHTSGVWSISKDVTGPQSESGCAGHGQSPSPAKGLTVSVKLLLVLQHVLLWICWVNKSLLQGGSAALMLARF